MSNEHTVAHRDFAAIYKNNWWLIRYRGTEFAELSKDGFSLQFRQTGIMFNSGMVLRVHILMTMVQDYVKDNQMMDE